MEVFANLPAGTVTSGGTDAPAQGTSESLTVTVTVAFPVASSGASPPTVFYFVDTSAPSEVMQATVCPGGTGAGQSWTVTRGADGTTPVTHQAGFAITQVIAKGTLGGFLQASDPYKPWQFYAGAYGAKGDGKVLTDAAMTSGSAVLTSASDPFTSADAGKAIMVSLAGPGGGSNPSGALITTIASYQNAGQVTLAATAHANVTTSAVYGTDDTAAIQAAMAALSSYSGFTGPPYYAELLFDPLTYILATPATPGGDSTYGYAQIPLPVIDPSGLTPKPTLVIRGVYDQATIALWTQTQPQVGGCTLLSMWDVSARDGTYGNASVIGGPTVQTPFGYAYDNLLTVVNGIQVTCPYNPGQIALDFLYMAQYSIGTFTANTFSSPSGSPMTYGSGNYEDGPAGLTNTLGVGVRTQFAGSNDRSDVWSLVITGYWTGFIIDQHVACHRVLMNYCNYGLYVTPGSGNSVPLHGAWIGYASVEICAYPLFCDGQSGAPNTFPLTIGLLDNEGNVSNNAVIHHIDDANNNLIGTVTLVPSGGFGSLSGDQPVINGASNYEIISTATYRGPQTAPDVPSSGATFQNPFWRHCMVTVTGGAVAAVFIDGVDTGLVNGVFLVPSGHTIKLDYTDAPSWNWWAQ